MLWDKAFMGRGKTVSQLVKNLLTREGAASAASLEKITKSAWSKGRRCSTDWVYVSWASPRWGALPGELRWGSYRLPFRMT
jgi:hypothetical protein